MCLAMIVCVELKALISCSVTDEVSNNFGRERKVQILHTIGADGTHTEAATDDF